MCQYHNKNPNLLPTLQIENQRKKDIHGMPIIISPTTAVNLPYPIQPSIFYMEAALPEQLQPATKMLNVYSSSSVDLCMKNILPLPLARSSIASGSTSSSSSSTTGSSPNSSSSFSVNDDEADGSSSSSGNSNGSNGNNKNETSSALFPLLSNSMQEESKPCLIGKQYNCRFCSKKFMRPSSLKIHIYSHTGEKPFNCTYPGCKRKFSVQSNMRRHLRVHSS